MNKSSKQPSATRIAADKIRHLIFTGELIADSNHLESELAERLGMSRTPVREATLTLQAQGLLDVQPRKGVKIKSISTDDVFYLRDVLSEMECMAARRAANHGYSKAELKTLFDSVDAMQQALNDDDRNAWAKADEAFHLELITLSQNKYLIAVVKNLNDQVRRVRAITLNIRPSPTQSNKEHSQMCQAILQGDADKADKVHRKHHQQVTKLLIGILDQSGLKRV